MVGRGRKGSIDPTKVAEAARLMYHRGPDGHGQWGIPDKVELAHLRLAIIDLSPENAQPFISTCGRYVIVFNGEIYNYIELREELVALGHVFRTQGDTEVLLTSYMQWGSDCVSRFNGDWAFGIFDTSTEVLFCSRDRFGIKPFNYAIIGDQLAFSSEIKGILHCFPDLRQPDYNLISNYCRNGLGAQNEATWFVGVKRLPPAHNLTWQDGKVRIEKYWDYPTDTLSGISEQDAVSTYRDLFTRAVKLRMRSDVPVGTTLSSGVDSGSIVSVLRTFFEGNHKTFTATFRTADAGPLEQAVYKAEVEIDEARLVEKLAAKLNLESHLVKSDSAGFVDKLSEVTYHLESGNSSTATVPLHRVFGVAREYVKVVLEGQGADEALAGYVVHTLPALIVDLLRAGRFGQARREFMAVREHYSIWYAVKMFVRLLNSSWTESIYHRLIGLDKVFGPKLRSYRRLNDYPANLPKFADWTNNVLCRAHAGGLVNLLHYGDALSMANSLESRLPFLDVNLVEFAFRLPYDLKVHDGLGKYIHRRAMKDVVPDFILSNPIKFGFNTPLAVHFNSLDSDANQILLSDRCLARELFDRSGLLKILSEQAGGQKDHSTFLFRLLSVELWFGLFVDPVAGTNEVHPGEVIPLEQDLTRERV